MKFRNEAVRDFVSDYAGALGVSPEVFVENTLIDLMARITVRQEIGLQYGLFIQFSEVGGSVLEGQELYDYLVGFYRGELDADCSREKRIAADEPEAIEKRRSDRDRLHEYQEQGLCPADFRGPAALAIRYIEQFKSGKVDKARLDSILSRYKRDKGRGEVE